MGKIINQGPNPHSSVRDYLQALRVPAHRLQESANPCASPCGGAKLGRPAPARELYTGSMFRHTLANAERCAAADEAAGLGPARVLVLSARYGLVELGQVMEPYDLRMGQPGSVSVATLAAQALALGIDWGAQVYALLPRQYLARLDAALRTLDVYVQNVYEATRGNGEQKRINVHIGRSEPATVPQVPGPTVWLGGDVHAFWWGTPLLVSYGRLRATKTLPAATAPWVCDSRAFSEIAQHGTWTISAEQYATDLTRYAQQIGHLLWAAPQDWPCSRPLLDKTGLTEAEHQRRTIASVLRLRELAPTVPIICVVTGLTAAGYLRHVQMYRAAGIDLRAEHLVVGVGALVGRRHHPDAVRRRATPAARLRGQGPGPGPGGRAAGQRRLGLLVQRGAPPWRAVPARPDQVGTQLPPRRAGLGRPAARAGRPRTRAGADPAVRPSLRLTTREGSHP